MIPSLFALACTPDTPEPADPAERVAVCVGEGEADSGADGVVETYLTHQLGDGWSELVSESADGTSTSVRSQTFDERGQLLTEDSAWSGPDGDIGYVATWVRDPDGLLLTYVAVDSTGFEIRDDYIYEDGLLARVERRLSGEAAPYVEQYEHDDAGRVVERRGDAIGVIRWAYFAPAPSLDARLTQDINGDGLLEGEASLFHDRTGRQIYVSSARWDGSQFWAAYDYGPTGDPVWALQVSEGADGRFESETSTERDEAGHPLRVESVNTTVTPGLDDVVSASLATWTWDCID
jgi:hypothetical protein